MLDKNDPYFSASNSDQEAVLRDHQERLQRQDLETIRVWMTHPNGRDFLWRLVQETSILSDPRCRTNGVTDTHETYYLLGMQSVGKRLIERMQMCGDLYMKMVAEAHENEELLATRLRKAGEPPDFPSDPPP